MQVKLGKINCWQKVKLVKSKDNQQTSEIKKTYLNNIC